MRIRHQLVTQPLNKQVVDPTKKFFAWYSSALAANFVRTIGGTILAALICLDAYNAFSHGYGNTRAALEAVGIVKPMDRPVGKLKIVTLRISGTQYKLVAVEEASE
jgi:hypothetical protein